MYSAQSALINGANWCLVGATGRDARDSALMDALGSWPRACGQFSSIGVRTTTNNGESGARPDTIAIVAIFA